MIHDIDLLFLQFVRGIPEGRRAPLADILHGDTRSVNTQTPNREHLSSGEACKLRSNFYLI